MNKDIILNKIVKDLPNKENRSQMSDVEWFGWFEEVWDKAINYNHCCETLKGKEIISFKEWLEMYNYKQVDENTLIAHNKQYSLREVDKQYQEWIRLHF